MKERPILFSAPMVRALLDGTKTQTRRVAKPYPVQVNDRGVIHEPCRHGQPSDLLWVRETWAETDRGDGTPVVAYRAGGCIGVGRDRLSEPDFLIPEYSWAETPHVERWRPSIFMPRWASRILLEITEARLERLQNISYADVIAEGVRIPVDAETGNVLLDISSKFAPAKYLPKPDPGSMTFRPRRAGRTAEWNLHLARAHYASLWDEINGTGAWDANPWVWVIEFKRVMS